MILLTWHSRTEFILNSHCLLLWQTHTSVWQLLMRTPTHTYTYNRFIYAAIHMRYTLEVLLQWRNAYLQWNGRGISEKELLSASVKFLLQQEINNNVLKSWLPTVCANRMYDEFSQIQLLVCVYVWHTRAFKQLHICTQTHFCLAKYENSVLSTRRHTPILMHLIASIW